MLVRLIEIIHGWFFECEDDVLEDDRSCDTLMGYITPGEKIVYPMQERKRRPYKDPSQS